MTEDAPAAAAGTRPRPMHPILFAMFPAIAIYSQNTHYLPWTAPVMPTLGIAGLTALGWGGVHLVFRNASASALITSVSLWLLFTFGPIHDLALTIKVEGMTTGRARFIGPLWALIWCAGCYATFRARERLELATRMANRLGMILLCVSLTSTLIGHLGGGPRADPQASLVDEIAFDPEAPDHLPDIYYIVLDAYGRADVLEALYAHDNRAFLEALEALGFVVADQSTSNYPFTHQSLPSTMNLDYVSRLVSGVTPETFDFDPLYRLSQDSRVVRILTRRFGYRFVAFETGYHLTSCVQADQYLAPGLFYWGELENALFHLTPIPEIGLKIAGRGASRGTRRHRARVLYTLEQLPKVTEMPGPTFTFAHILCPHSPFVFGENGEEISNPLEADGLEPFSMVLAREGRTIGQEYRRLYRAQLAYISRRVLEVVRQILARSKTRPIIIIQGDHGPSSTFPNAGDYWDRSEDAEIRAVQHWERFGILNAMLLPGRKPDWLRPQLSAINTFRGILKEYFGARLELLPNRQWWTEYALPYGFTEVAPQTNRTKLQNGLRKILGPR